MSFFYNYIYGLFFPVSEEITNDDDNDNDNDDLHFVNYSIKTSDLQSVTLNSVKDIPRKSRIHDKVDMKNLNNGQLKEILNVRLRPVIREELPKKEYKHRHPVFNELLKKTEKK